MGPSSIDAEIRSLGPSAGGDIKLLELFMLFIERQIGSRRDFEFTEAILGLFLKVSDFKALCTRIRIFLNPQLFLSGFKNFLVHTWRIQIGFACSHATDGIRIQSSTQGSSAIKCVQSMHHKARYSGGEFTLLLLLCRHIGLLFGKRLDTNLLCHWIRKYPDSAVHTLSDSLRIYFFLLWRADLKMSGFAVEFAGCVWTEAPERRSCGFKNIRIRADGA